PVTGSVSCRRSLRTVLSLAPVHTSKRGFETSPATFSTAAGDRLEGICPAPEAPSDDALARNLLRSARSTGTSMPARMCAVLAPPTFSVPTTVGLVSHLSGSIPILLSGLPLEPERLPGDPAIDAKLDSSRWKLAAGSW